MRETPCLFLVPALLFAAACREAPAPPSPDSSAAPPEPPAFAFEDATAASGLSFEHDNGAEGFHHYVETMAPGVALFDADGDGDLDLYVVDGGPLPGSQRSLRPSNRLFLNSGDGTFTTAEGSGAEDQGYGMGVTVGDADGDGDLDLYVLNYGVNAFLRNLGGGRFERAAVGAEDPAWSVSGAFLDADGDGDLDLYVVNYLDYDVEKEKPCKAGTLQIYCSPEQYPPVADRYYENRDGRFVEASAAAGITTVGRGMGIGVADLDDDLLPDLYVTNDRSFNFLYRNRGGRFEETAAESGVGYGPTGATEGGMGVATGDFTGSGKPAIFLTNFQKEPNRLYVEAFEGFYDDLSLRSGLGFPSSEMVGWGIGARDFEGDGDLDLVVANGHVFDNAEEFIPGSAFALPDQLFLNDGDGRFEVETFPGSALSSRGLATGDVDGDGDPDLVIAACGGPLKLWRNTADSPQRFLKLRLLGAGANRHAFGARLVARVGAMELRRQVAGGGSYASHSATEVILGLGSAGAADRLEVTWPDGSRESVQAVSGGRSLVWRQGEGVVEESPLRGGGA